MALTIKTTGVEDYLDGSANIKMLVIGAPGSGKTRMASFWPKPIYADVEGGRGSLVDRRMPYAAINSSTDMLSFLTELRKLEQTPKAMRKYQTVVIDTLDGYQRKVKDEWLQREKKQTFTGYDAWGFLDSQMSQLMTRLLNLDYNVIVAVHYKDKIVKKGDDEFHELMLHLQGDVKDTAFYDFDLVSWLGTYWEAVEGKRVEKRGLSFQKTPDKPFLKDRFGIMPAWIPITLTSTDDYQQIFEAFLSQLEDLPEAETVDEFPDATPEDLIPRSLSIVGPVGGALPPVDPKDVPLTQFDKPTLATMARELGITTTIDGQPIKGNTLKSELVQAIEAHRAKEAGSGANNSPAQAPSAAATQSAPAPSPAAAPAQAAAPAAEPAAAAATTDSAAAPSAPPAVATPPTPAGPASPPADPEPVATSGADDAPQAEAGLAPGESVDPTTGEITHDQAVENVQKILGGQIESDVPLAEEAPQANEPAPAAAATPTAPPAPAAPAQSRPEICEQEGCDKPLAGEVPQYVQLSGIKFKAFYCNEHYLERRRAQSSS